MMPQIDARSIRQAATGVLQTAYVWLPLMMLLGGCVTTPDTRNTPQTNTASRPNGVGNISPARDAALDALITRQERVYKIATPLITKNAVLCRTQARPLLGFTAKNQYSYPPELMASARRTLGLDDRLQVMQVLDGSGAMRAGLARGDILQSIQDIIMPQGSQAETEAARLLAPALKNLSEIRVTVLRRGQTLNLQVPLTLACAFAIDIGNAPNMNAYADGRRIMITRGLLDALTADEDIASILSREIAHNVLQHARQLQQTATVSGVIDSLLPLNPEPASYAGGNGIKAMPEKMDIEADRLAMFMLARSGYDPLALARVSKHLMEIAPPGLPNTYSAQHPWTADRQSQAQSAIKEIHQKQAAKKPLVP